ncbi:unnamed protein product [Pocillopora meandrina]|uniref:Uncharacterized protein n=1 Tax=Pocillopora meandrina TaxID=46732 RepID=A0AAU9XNM1_9CNID|nr:unnamed protein product [Pocillopora meandrina]
MEFEKRANMPGCLDEIDEKEDLLGYISNMTPMMTSGSKKYFNCHINTKNQKKRAVCFSPKKRKIPSKDIQIQDKLEFTNKRHCHQPGYQ